MNTYIKPYSDIFIKYLLGSEKNKDLLLSFINAVITDSKFTQIVDVEVKNPFNIKNFPIDKESILDIKATDEHSRQYNIEVQSIGSDHFKLRSLYYWSKLYSNQLIEGTIYTKLKPCICINILNFNLLKDTNTFHNCFLLREINNPEYILTDHLILHFLELPKLEERVQNNKLIKWLLYLKYEGQKEDMMQILIQDDTQIAKAHNEYKNFTQDEKLRELYEARIRWKMDHDTDIAVAKQEGLDEGKQEGEKIGIQTGIQKGIQTGELKNQQNVLIKLIDKKFGTNENEIKIIQTIEDMRILDKALEYLLVADNKEEVMKCLQ